MLDIEAAVLLAGVSGPPAFQGRHQPFQSVRGHPPLLRRHCLPLSRSSLGADLADPEQAASNTQRKLRTEALVSAFQATVTQRLLPALRTGIANELGVERTGLEGWALTQDTIDPGTLHFAYPRSVSDALVPSEELAYIRPEVRIELGGRNDDWPAHIRTVTAFVAQELSQIVPAAISIRVLAAERTFWEKATILHAEYHRPLGKSSGERLSRHYSDLAQMAETEIEVGALADLALLARARVHKTAFYTSTWASYETAVPGSLRLAPRPERLDSLRADYRGMEEMFFSPAVPFDAMMEKITALERRVNALAEQ